MSFMSLGQQVYFPLRTRLRLRNLNVSVHMKMIVEDAAEDELEFNYLCLKRPCECYMKSHTHCVNHLERLIAGYLSTLLSTGSIFVQPADTLQLFSGHQRG